MNADGGEAVSFSDPIHVHDSPRLIRRGVAGSVATLQECFDKLGRYGPRTLSRRSVQMAPI